MNYYAALAAESLLLGGGPFIDSSGGMMIFAATVSAEDAERGGDRPRSESGPPCRRRSPVVACLWFLTHSCLSGTFT